MRRLYKNEKGDGKNPRLSDWIARKNAADALEDESNYNKYYIAAGIIILLCLGWYYWDNIEPIPGNIWGWFRKSNRPGNPSSGSGNGSIIPNSSSNPSTNSIANDGIVRNELSNSSNINDTSRFNQSIEVDQGSPLIDNVEPTYNPIKWISRKINKKMNDLSSKIEDNIVNSASKQLESLRNDVKDSISKEEEFKHFFKDKGKFSATSVEAKEINTLINNELSANSVTIIKSDKLLSWDSVLTNMNDENRTVTLNMENCIKNTRSIKFS